MIVCTEKHSRISNKISLLSSIINSYMQKVHLTQEISKVVSHKVIIQIDSFLSKNMKREQVCNQSIIKGL